ncbi:MAG: hypothetical protein U9Q91_06815 [Candidatus Marinimicrobia bacterium]|nr:hypothetical protein [Candidatus Neomarinimicrobiota bacterium]
MSHFEIIMLICFGAAWPFSIFRSWKSHSTKGKSLLFMIIVMIGYIAGVLHKLVFDHDLVIYLYALNFLMVAVDVALYLRNRSGEKKSEKIKV